MRGFLWLNATTLCLLWLFVGQGIYYETYGWWIGSSYGMGHSPVILLFLAIPLLACGVVIVNLALLLKRPNKPYKMVLYGVSSTLLILGSVGFFWLPQDRLNSLTVSTLGPGPRAKILLYNSAAWGHINTVKTLLDAGVQLSSDESFTYIGATFGQIEIIKMGIARGDNINGVGPQNRTPLRSAIGNRQLAAIEFLLSNGAIATEEDKYSISVLHGKQSLKY